MVGLPSKLTTYVKEKKKKKIYIYVNQYNINKTRMRKMNIMEN